jgi:hypothetical protein
MTTKENRRTTISQMGKGQHRVVKSGDIMALQLQTERVGEINLVYPANCMTKRPILKSVNAPYSLSSRMVPESYT